MVGLALARAQDLAAVPYLEAVADKGNRQAAAALAELLLYWAHHWSNKASEPPPDTVME